jgi:hypothetical protein
VSSTASDAFHNVIVDEPPTPSALSTPEHLRSTAGANVRVTMHLSPTTALAAVALPDEKSRVADVLAVTEKLVKSVANRDLSTFELVVCWF